MAGIENNLYPPIISTYMPAFVRTTSCRVYFSLSKYNTFDDILNVQVIVSYQNSSLSALDSEQYPAGIKITTLNINREIEGDDKYYIVISPNDLRDGEFEIGEYYKVQIRFTSTDADPLEDSKKIAPWLTNNQAYFSEWSTVCLIRGIEKPSIYIRGFEDATETNDVVFTSDVIDLVGQMYYAQNSELEDEYLKQYQVLLYNADDGTLLYTSEIIYTNEFYPNEINYTLKYPLEDGIRYLIELDYTTNNLYTNNVAYYFSILPLGADRFDGTIMATPDIDNGRIQIHVQSTNSNIYFGNICIRRTSGESNFLIWEDIKIVTIEDGHALDYIWYDYTIQGGIYYKYGVQNIDSQGRRGAVTIIRNPVMVYMKDMFLTQGDFQLRIKYDPTISSFKINLIESKTDTIGSKYPFINRNGNVFYKTFPITGLITAFCDEDHLFTSEEDFYQDAQEYYDEYNWAERITAHKDFVYEKFFRDKVMDFLYENNIKLFRSLTEGNILVRLMDISFTPNQTLGRMLYSFTATAYEIDECSIDNYVKYGIIEDIGTYSDTFNDTYRKTSQLNGSYTANKDLINIIQDQLTNESPETDIQTVQCLTWIRLEFQSDPYLIKCGTDGSLEPLSTSDPSIDDNVVYGYIVYINGEPILVTPRRYFELNDDDTVVTSIYFPVETEVILDYTAEIEIHEDTTQNNSTTKLSYSKKLGQLWGSFDINTCISNIIYLKHLEQYSDYYQKVISIDRLTIEADPGTVIYLQDSVDDDCYRHEIGASGVLDFYDDEAIVLEAWCCGVHLNEMVDLSRLEPEDDKFRETGITVNTIEDIEDPQKNCVYTVNQPIDYSTRLIGITNIQYKKFLQEIIEESNQYIYYHNQWYLFTNNHDVLCPVEALIDYTYELERGEY